MSQLKLADHVRRLSDEDGAVLLNLQNGKYYSLNRLGDCICEALTTGMTQEEVVSLITEKYDGVPDTIHSEVESFVKQLRGCALLGGGK
jgi:Coenzyme PQQ synthesis protein D (PqqD)